MEQYEMSEETSRKIAACGLAQACVIALFVGSCARRCVENNLAQTTRLQESGIAEQMEPVTLYDGNGLPQSYELRLNESIERTIAYDGNGLPAPQRR